LFAGYDQFSLAVANGLKGNAAMVEWYYKADGEEHGPVSQGELQALAALGQIAPDDLVRNDKKPKWYPARAVKGLVVDDDDLGPSAAPESSNQSREVLDLEAANEHLSERVFVPKSRKPKPAVNTDIDPNETKDTAEQILSKRKKNAVFGASRAELEAANATPADLKDELRYFFGWQLPSIKKLAPAEKLCITLTLGAWLLLTLFAPFAAPPEAWDSPIYNTGWDPVSGKPGADVSELSGRHSTWLFTDGPQFSVDLRHDISWLKRGIENVQVDKNAMQQSSSAVNRDGVNLQDLMKADMTSPGDGKANGVRSGQLQAPGKKVSNQVLAYSRMTVNWFRWSVESMIVLLLGGVGFYALRIGNPSR